MLGRTFLSIISFIITVIGFYAGFRIGRYFDQPFFLVAVASIFGGLGEALEEYGWRKYGEPDYNGRLADICSRHRLPPQWESGH